MNLKSPVSQIPGVGAKFEAKFRKLNIHTINDLLEHYPVYYHDRRQITRVVNAPLAEVVNLEGYLTCSHSIRLRSGKSLETGSFSDVSGILKVTWFNQPYLKTTLRHPTLVKLTGKINLYRGQRTLTAPTFEIISDTKPSLHFGRLVPHYAQTAGMSSQWLRQKIYFLLQLPELRLTEWLPEKIITDYHLLTFDKAIKYIHFPSSSSKLASAQQSLGFRELYLYQLQAQISKNKRAKQSNALAHPPNINLVADFIRQLPFALTTGQQQAVTEIIADLRGETPMNRLIQGDVGSGKTVVAAIAALITCQEKLRVILLAPTEVLVLQHAKYFEELFKSTPYKISIQTRSRHDSTDANILIGTHALLHRTLPKETGLIIIDEEHRFGVKQRQTLVELSPTPAHLLSLTATPIPRTVALTLYSELDITRINELPPGRKPVITRVVSTKNRYNAYNWLRPKIKSGEQLFIVCPLVEPSEQPLMDQVKSAKTEFTMISQEIFPECRVGVIHGKLSSMAKASVINQFRTKQLDILVATPVIEVGVDIPEASFMLIESAERFGLATLHQLRGRVGRGARQSYCFLFTSSGSMDLARLKYLEKIHSGHELAELDMKIRGPGNLFGTKQSGFIHTKIASLTDQQLINRTFKAAQDTIKFIPLERNKPLTDKLQTMLEKNSLES